MKKVKKIKYNKKLRRTNHSVALKLIPCLLLSILTICLVKAMNQVEVQFHIQQYCLSIILQPGSGSSSESRGETEPDKGD